MGYLMLLAVNYVMLNCLYCPESVIWFSAPEKKSNELKTREDE